jgi:acetyl esterase/lipase
MKNYSKPCIFFNFFTIIIIIFLSACQESTDEAGIMMKTYTFKKVGDLEIKADVYRADDTLIRPAVVWIHGGALIMGHRESVKSRVKKMMLDAGYAIISIDYRLAPETKLPAIIEDLEDAFTWIGEKGPELFFIDPSKIAVMGGSAGGYLTLTSGFRCKPSPTVLVVFYGYGDLIGDWYSTPSGHARHNQIKLTKEEAYQQVSGPPISDSRFRKGNGGHFYQYCRQKGFWPEAVSGWNPHTEPQKFDPYMPVKNVTKSYPPTMLIHGTEDTDVPYEQSVLMARLFEKYAIEHQFITIPGAEHGLGDGDPKLIDDAYESILGFVNHYMIK